MQERSRYLAFSLHSEEYAVPLLSVREVIAMPETTPVPHTPPHFIGIMNLRGQVISVIDLRAKLGIQADKSAETAVVIVDLAGVCLGMVVSKVNSVLNLAEGEIKPRPEIQSTKKTDYIRGVAARDDKLVLLIDVASALDVADRVAMAAGNPASQNQARSA